MKKILVFLAVVAATLFVSCEKQSSSSFTPSSVTTQDPTQKGDYALVLNGTLTSNGGNIVNLGFAVAQGHNPKISTDPGEGTTGVLFKAENDPGTSGAFTSTFSVERYTPEGRYYYRAVVQDINLSTGEYTYSYGEEKTFVVGKE